MNIDRIEDILELKSKSVKKDLAKSMDEYRKGKAKDARKLLKTLKQKPLHPVSKYKQI